MKKLLHSILNLSEAGVGQGKNHRSPMSYSMLIANSYALLSIGFLVFHFIVFFLLGYPGMASSFILAIPGYALVIFLNSFQRDQLSRLFFVFWSNFVITSFVLTVADAPLAQLWYTVLICYPLTFWRPFERAQLLLSLLIPTALLSLFSAGLLPQFSLYQILPQHHNFIAGLNLGSSALNLFLTLVIYFRYLGEKESELNEGFFQLKKALSSQTSIFRKLLREKKKLEGIFEAMPLVVFLYDRDFRVVSVNSYLRKAYGAEPEQLLGKRMIDLIAGLGNDVSIYEEAHRRVVAEGKVVTVTNKIDYQGRSIWHEVTYNPVFSEQKEIVGFLGVVKDITQQKNSENDLREALSLAKSANETKKAFLAKVSHEVRTPLAAISAEAEIALGGLAVGTGGQLALNNMVRHIEDIKELLDQILDVSKIESGQFEVKPAEFGPRSYFHRFVSMIKAQGETCNVLLQFEIHGNVPDKFVNDSRRLQQILMNLTSNAFKFTQPGGQIILRCRWDAQKWLLQFEVEDNGLGIPPERHRDIFDPFVQVHSAASEANGGTGLGLFLSRELARQMGGELYLRSSKPAEGSLFVLELPDLALKQSIALPTPPAFQPIVPSKGSPTLPKDLQILLVEDHPDLRLLTQRLLVSQGVGTVDVALDGQQAIEMATAKIYDLVLMDLQLPLIDGYEATRRLRHSGYSRPIVALTARAMKEDVAKCLEVGMNCCLSKPLNMERLRAILPLA